MKVIITLDKPVSVAEAGDKFSEAEYKVSPPMKILMVDVPGNIIDWMKELSTMNPAEFIGIPVRAHTVYTTADNIVGIFTLDEPVGVPTRH